MEGMSFSAQACQDFLQAVEKEWRWANPQGSYSSSTIIGANTRKSHGLFAARLKDPLGSYVLVNSLDEILYVDETPYPISTRIQQSRVFPAGYKYLEHFFSSPVLSWIFQFEDLVLEKNLILLKEEQTVLLRYRLLEGNEDFVRLEIKPLMGFRPVNGLCRESTRLNTALEVKKGRIGLAGLYFYHNAPITTHENEWYRNIQYPKDKELKQDYEEDLYAPFRLVYAFSAYRENFFAVSLVSKPHLDFPALIASAVE